MARILFGWELGANQGHVSRILQVAAPLLERGHELALALQDTSHVSGDLLHRISLFQAPIWPRLLASQLLTDKGGTNSMGDILCRLGLDRPETLASLVTAWHTIFAAFQPDIAIADYAPALQRAGRGRMPVIALGTGFSLPPASLKTFPVLVGKRSLWNEDEALDRINSGLAGAGLERLASFPSLFEADVPMVQSFDALDPYRGTPDRTYSIPAMASPLPQAASGEGEEIFFYGFERMMSAPALWQGLCATGFAISAYLPRVSPGFARRLTAMGIKVEPAPLTFAEIGKRARVVISHGGHGFASSAIMAGLPQVVIHYDLEKLLVGRQVAEAGLGGHTSLQSIKVEPFAKSLSDYFANDDAHRRVRALSENYRKRVPITMSEDVIAQVERLIG